MRLGWYGAALTTCLFLGYLIALPEHLVHHVFEPDAHQLDCAFLAAAERTEGVPAEQVVTTPIELGTAERIADQPTPLTRSVVPASARAPPLLAA